MIMKQSQFDNLEKINNKWAIMFNPQKEKQKLITGGISLTLRDIKQKREI